MPRRPEDGSHSPGPGANPAQTYILVGEYFFKSYVSDPARSRDLRVLRQEETWHMVLDSSPDILTGTEQGTRMREGSWCIGLKTA